ncbi:MAG: four helix bundle protein [Chitinophagales bacterium]|nr:four helix bundle protein [Chitinophagales bacterium]
MRIWELSIDLVTQVYRISADFPPLENYGLKSQIQRAVISIPSNIAEGSGRGTNKDFGRFLDIAMGSLFELETQFEIAKQLKYIENEVYNDFLDKCTEVQKMIYSFRKSIQNNN